MYFFPAPLMRLYLLKDFFTEYCEHPILQAHFGGTKSGMYLASCCTPGGEVLVMSHVNDEVGVLGVTYCAAISRYVASGAEETKYGTFLTILAEELWKNIPIKFATLKGSRINSIYRLKRVLFVNSNRLRIFTFHFLGTYLRQ